MLLAKVRGTVVSTCKEPSLSGVKFLLVQLISETGDLLPITPWRQMWSVQGQGNGC
jgi:microcompartment protein CcmK/EutM